MHFFINKKYENDFEYSKLYKTYPFPILCKI